MKPDFSCQFMTPSFKKLDKQTSVYNSNAPKQCCSFKIPTENCESSVTESSISPVEIVFSGHFLKLAVAAVRLSRNI